MTIVPQTLVSRTFVPRTFVHEKTSEKKVGWTKQILLGKKSWPKKCAGEKMLAGDQNSGEQ